MTGKEILFVVAVLTCFFILLSYEKFIQYCDVFMKNVLLLYFAVVELFTMDISAAVTI